MAEGWCDRLPHLLLQGASWGQTAVTASSFFDQESKCSSVLQVVGRVHQGDELLQQLNACPVDTDDKPSPPLVISACGITNARVRAGECDASTYCT